MKLWLLEINKCPAMDYSSPVTSELVPRLMKDLPKVLIDYKLDKSADLGDFELIFEGPRLKYGVEFKNELSVEGIGYKK